jgi:hypothetical protein
MSWRVNKLTRKNGHVIVRTGNNFEFSENIILLPSKELKIYL